MGILSGAIGGVRLTETGSSDGAMAPGVFVSETSAPLVLAMRGAARGFSTSQTSAISTIALTGAARAAGKDSAMSAISPLALEGLARASGRDAAIGAISSIALIGSSRIAGHMASPAAIASIALAGSSRSAGKDASFSALTTLAAKGHLKSAGTRLAMSAIAPLILSGKSFSAGRIAFYGSPAVGQLLMGIAAVWLNTPVTSSWQWNRGGTPIAGATALNYTPVPADIGFVLTLTETALNSGGYVAATSAPTGIVIAGNSDTLNLVLRLSVNSVPVAA